MIQKKICTLGFLAVGKTSRVSGFVRSIFSDKHRTTSGVKVDKKVEEPPSGPLPIILWDSYGADDFQSARPSFLRGKARSIILLNKSELQSEGELGEREQKSLAGLGPVIRTRAKTGEGVEAALAQLTAQLQRSG